MKITIELDTNNLGGREDWQKIVRAFNLDGSLSSLVAERISEEAREYEASKLADEKAGVTAYYLNTLGTANPVPVVGTVSAEETAKRKRRTKAEMAESAKPADTESPVITEEPQPAEDESLIDRDRAALTALISRLKAEGSATGSLDELNAVLAELKDSTDEFKRVGIFDEARSVYQTLAMRASTLTAPAPKVSDDEFGDEPAPSPKGLSMEEAQKRLKDLATTASTDRNFGTARVKQLWAQIGAAKIAEMSREQVDQAWVLLNTHYKAQ